MQTRHSAWYWVGMVSLLWAVWALRAHQALLLPLFVDESLHLIRAQLVFRFEDALASIIPRKLLLYYYLGAFQPQDHNGAWLARQALALTAPLSAALCYALLKDALRGQDWRAWALLLLYALAPLPFFFERLALADPLVSVLGLALVWWGRHFAHRPSPRRALLLGLLMGLTLLAKLTALPLLIMPLLALHFWGRGGWRGHWKALLLAYGLAGLLLLPSVGYVLYQELAPVAEKPETVNAELIMPGERSRPAQIAYNLEIFAEALWKFNAPLLLAALGAALLGLTARRPSTPRADLLYLLLALGGVWAFVLLVGAFPSTRYLMLGYPLTLVIIALGLPQGGRAAAWGVALLAGLGLLLSLPFIARYFDDPSHLDIGRQNVWEYFTHSSSGYALRDAAADINTLPPLDGRIPLTGFVGNCHSLRLYWPADHAIDLHCPYYKFNAGMIPALEAEWQARVAAAGAWYFLVEDLALVDFGAMALEPELLRRYERPSEAGVTVWLYRVRPGQPRPQAWFHDAPH